MIGGMGDAFVRGAVLALGDSTAKNFKAPHKLMIELSGILGQGVFTDLPKEKEARITTILEQLEKERPNLSENEVTIVQKLSKAKELKEDYTELKQHAPALKKIVDEKWGSGWNFIFEQFETLKFHLEGQKDNSGLIDSLTQKTVESLKAGFVGTPPPILANARQTLAQLLEPGEAPQVEAAKSALVALLEKPQEAFSGGKELSEKDKEHLKKIRIMLDHQAHTPFDTLKAAIGEGQAILDKYAAGIQQAAFIPSVVESLFKTLQKKVNGTEEPAGSARGVQMAGAIPPPNVQAAIKKPLTYGAAFQGYLESAMGFFSHAIDRQMALKYASTILWGVDLALKNTNEDPTKEKPLLDAKDSILASMKEIKEASSETKIKELVEKMTKNFREKLHPLQIYLNSIKLPIQTIEKINVPIERLLEVENAHPAPVVVHATKEKIQDATEEFTKATIDFVRKNYGIKPFDAFYIRGFITNVVEFVRSYVEAHGAKDDKYYQIRKGVTLQSDKFFRILKVAIEKAKLGETFETALARELMKSEKGITGKEEADMRTPQQIYDEFMSWVVDRFAPKHEWCKEVNQLFKQFRVGSPFLNVPLTILATFVSWVSMPFVFIFQTIANGISPWILKKIASKTELLPTLIKTSEKAAGFNDEYQYIKDKALYTQLLKLWKLLKYSKGQGKEITISKDMEGRLQDLAVDVLRALDAHSERLDVSSTGFIPEKWVDTLAKGEVINGLVQGLALAFNEQFEKQNLDDQILDVLQLLKECYEDPLYEVRPAIKAKMEADLELLVHKMVFFFVNKSIQDKFNPTATYQREAAKWLDMLQKDAESTMTLVLAAHAEAGYEKMNRFLLEFFNKQHDRVLELQGNENLDISTREMLKNLLGQGASTIQRLLFDLGTMREKKGEEPEIVELKAGIQEKVEAVDAWVKNLKNLKEIPFLNIKVFDTDPFLDIITRVAYARYKPAVDSILQLARKAPVLEGWIRQVVMLPVLNSGAV